MSITKVDNEKHFDTKNKGHTYVQWIAAILVATTMLNYGLQSGWISPMKIVLQSDTSPAGRPLTDNEMSWIASTMPLAAVVGSSFYYFICDKYGRKTAAIAMIVPQALCWIIKLVSAHTIALIVARICAGLPAGGCFNLLPVYVKEISQENNRGILVTFGMSCQNIGYLAMYAMGGYLNYYVVLWIVMIITVTAGILLIVIAPESPAFLVKKGKIEDAAKIVAKLRGLDVHNKIVQHEMEYMKEQDEQFKSVESLTYLSIFKNKARRRAFLLCLFNLTIMPLNGCFSINTYAWTIITDAGVTVQPELQTLSIPAIMILGSLVSMICVEKCGRKPILVGGFVLSAASLGSLAAILLLQRHAIAAPSWAPVLAIVVTVWAYGASVLPIVYVVMSEMFIFQVRAKLIGLIVMYAWFVSFIQVYCFLPVSNNFGMHTTFFVFSAINLVGAVVCLIFLPETMRKTVEEIEQLLLGKKSAKTETTSF